MGRESYAANLQNVGLVLTETERLLGAYAETRDWRQVRMRALEENLLGKRSTTTVRHILKVVRRRYVDAPTWLPAPELAGRFFTHPSISARAKAEVAFLYVLAEDRLVREAVDTLVLNRRPAHLHVDDVLGFMHGLEREHAELARWRPYLRRRWSSGLLTLLRDVGFMEPAPSWRVRDLIVLPAAFALVFAWLAGEASTPRAALEHEVFRFWALDGEERTALLRAGNERGWWQYSSAGGLLELRIIPHSLEGLVDDLE